MSLNWQICFCRSVMACHWILTKANKKRFINLQNVYSKSRLVTDVFKTAEIINSLFIVSGEFIGGSLMHTHARTPYRSYLMAHARIYRAWYTIGKAYHWTNIHTKAFNWHRFCMSLKGTLITKILSFNSTKFYISTYALLYSSHRRFDAFEWL